MKLGVFSTTFFTHETVMGVSNTAYLISKILTEDYDTEVFVFAPLEKLAKQKKREDLPGLHVRRFDTLGPKAFGVFRSGKISEKFDAVHSYHYGYFPASAGFRHAIKSKTPHFLTTAYHPHQLSAFRKALFSLYNRFEGKKLLKNSSAVLPFNNNEMGQLVQISKGNYIPSPSPINTDVFYPDRKAGRKRNSGVVVGYVGNFLPWKGARVAMDICKQIESEGRDVSFVFIGRGFLEDELKRKASGNFTFLKDVPIKSLAEWYNKIDILIYPSFYESFGRVLAEAVTCGCAVVSTRVGAIPETVGPGGVLVEYGNWGAMESKVVELIEKKRLRQKLGKDGMKYARKYDHREVASGVFGIYSSFVN